MYKVNAIVTIPEGKRKFLLEGIFFPKGETAEAKTIKDQTEKFIRANMKVDDSLRDKLIIKINYKKITDDFMVLEDKI